MSLGLMLHCGAKEIEREAIKDLPTPEAIETPRKNGGMTVWQPIEHEFLVRYTEQSLLNQGFSVVNRQFGVTPNGARFFGLMEIEGNNIDGNGNAKWFTLGTQSGSRAHSYLGRLSKRLRRRGPGMPRRCCVVAGGGYRDPPLSRARSNSTRP